MPIAVQWDALARHLGERHRGGSMTGEMAEQLFCVAVGRSWS